MQQIHFARAAGRDQEEAPEAPPAPAHHPAPEVLEPEGILADPSDAALDPRD